MNTFLLIFEGVYRALGVSPSCEFCGNGDGVVLHVLLDFINVTQLWIHIVPSDFITNLFSFDCIDWFFNNLSKKGFQTNTSRLKTIFKTTCWFLWKWRNSAIFEEDFQRLFNLPLMIQILVKDIEDCNLEPLLESLS